MVAEKTWESLQLLIPFDREIHLRNLWVAYSGQEYRCPQCNKRDEIILVEGLVMSHPNNGQGGGIWLLCKACNREGRTISAWFYVRESS